MAMIHRPLFPEPTRMKRPKLRRNGQSNLHRESIWIFVLPIGD